MVFPNGSMVGDKASQPCTCGIGVANVRKSCISFFIVWFKGFTVIVTDVEEVSSFSVGGLERHFPVVKYAIAFGFSAEFP